jgi:hypothetical protein
MQVRQSLTGATTRRALLEFVYRFLLCGLIVSTFSVIADVVKSKGFAGLFGAATSVALATLALTLLNAGRCYSTNCCEPTGATSPWYEADYLMNRYRGGQGVHVKSLPNEIGTPQFQ